MVLTDYRELDIQIEMPHFVVERQPDAGWSNSGRTADDQCVIGYAKCGEAFYTMSGRIFTVGRGDIVFFPMGAHHSAKNNPADPWAFYSVCFTLTCGDELSRRMISSLPNIFRCSGTPRMAADFADLSRVWSTREKGYKLKCRSLLLDIM